MKRVMHWTTNPDDPRVTLCGIDVGNGIMFHTLDTGKVTCPECKEKLMARVTQSIHFVKPGAEKALCGQPTVSISTGDRVGLVSATTCPFCQDAWAEENRVGEPVPEREPQKLIHDNPVDRIRKKNRERSEAEVRERCSRLELAIKQFLGWGTLGTTDRTYFDRQFREALEEP